MALPMKGAGTFKPLVTDRPSKKQQRQAKKAAERKRVQDDERSTSQSSTEAVTPSNSIVNIKAVSTAEAVPVEEIHTNTVWDNGNINEPEPVQPHLVMIDQKLDWAADATAEAEAYAKAKTSMTSKTKAPSKAEVDASTESRFEAPTKKEAETPANTGTETKKGAHTKAEIRSSSLAPIMSQVTMGKSDVTDQSIFKGDGLNTNHRGIICFRNPLIKQIRFGTFEEPWDIPNRTAKHEDDVGATKQLLKGKPLHTSPTPASQRKDPPQMPAPLVFPIDLSKSLKSIKNPREMTLAQRQALIRGPGSDPMVTILTSDVSNGSGGTTKQSSRHVGVVRKRLLEHFSKRAGKELKNLVRQDWNVCGVTADAISILLEWMTKSCGTLNIQNLRSEDITVEEWLNVWEAAAILDSETAQWKLADQMYADMKSLSIPELLEAQRRANARGVKPLETAARSKLYGVVRNKRDISLEELMSFWTFGSGNDHLVRKAVEAFAKTSFYEHYAGRKGVAENKIEGFDELDPELKDLVRWSWKYEEKKCYERRSAGWFQLRERQANMTPEERELDRQREKQKFERRKQNREQNRLDLKANTELAARNEKFWANKDNSGHN